MSEFTITKKQVAYMLDVEERSVSNFQINAAHPLPIKERSKRGSNKGLSYDPKDVLKWAIKKELNKLKIDEVGSIIDIDKEKARLTKEQADSIAIKNEEARRNLIPKWVLEAALENVSAQIAAVLDGVKHEIKKKEKGVSSKSLDIIESALARGRNIAVRIKPDYSKLDGDDK